MSTPFIITDSERAALQAAVERARKKPVPLAEVMRAAGAVDQSTDRVTLAERKAAPPKRDPEQVVLPFGYRLAISFEEQPAGMCLHLSMSSPTRGRIPKPEAMALVIQELGIDADIARVWLEEFEIDGKSGGHAINLIAVVEPTPNAGHA